MSPLSNKHSNAQRVFYSGFDGGLNLSVPNESLPKNELKEALNVEFSPMTGNMKVRGGLVWSGRFPTALPVKDVVPVHGRKGFLVQFGTAEMNAPILYFFKWNNVWPVTLSNYSWLTNWNERMSIVSWEDKDGTDCWLLVGGGHLHKFTDIPLPTLKTISTAPSNCRLVFVRDGRVGLVCGDDTIRFSAVGDCEDWTIVNVEDTEDSEDTETDDTDVESDDTEDANATKKKDTDDKPKWIDIGYKDGMNIDAVVPLSKDLIIFKSPTGEPDKGTIYRLTGSYPNWAVVEVAHNTGTFSQQSVCVVGNDIFYATVAGIATLSTVTSYGEVRTAWPDRKVSNALTPELDSTARLYDVPVKQQLWVAPRENSNEIWVLDYAHGIWTKFEFPKRIVYAAGVDNSLYVFIGQDLYEVSDSYTQDELRDEGQQKITAKMKLGTLLSGIQTLVKGVFASFDLKPNCKAELVLGKWKMPFTYGGGDVDYIYSDTDVAYDDTDPLVPEGGVLTSRRRCIVRDWAITPEIRIEGGGCAVSTIGLEIMEV